MSWIGDVIREFRYQCKQGHVHGIKLKTSEHKKVVTEDLVCLTCKEPVKYAGFKNIDASEGGMNMEKPSPRMSFDKNGRKAFKVGNSYMSETKWNYMETGKIENVYTSGFKDHQDKLVQKQVAKAYHDVEKHLAKGGGLQVDQNALMDPSQFTPM